MHKTKRDSEAGFTMIEAMIAAMILGLALSSVLAISAYAFRYLSDIRLTARSSQVLQQKMEDLRLLSWSDLQAVSNAFDDPVHPGLFNGQITQVPYSTYNGQTTTARVTLTVTWANRNSSVSTNSLTTIVANGGLNKYIF